MSFEGYYQTLCMAGHYHEEPYEYSGEEPKKCSTCGLDQVVINLVDETNLDVSWGVIPKSAWDEVKREDGTYGLPDLTLYEEHSDGTLIRLPERYQ